MAYSIGIITSPTEDIDLGPALREFPELRNDYRKIMRPTGDVDLLIGIQDARLHPYLADPGKHCRGNLRLLTSMFGTGYLIDGTHPEIKVRPNHLSPGATERSRGTFTFVKRRGFKKRPKTSHRTSRVAMVDTLGCEELEEPKSNGRPTGGDDFSNDPASGDAGVVGGVSRVSPSWGSPSPSTLICELGNKGPREPTGRRKLRKG